MGSQQETSGRGAEGTGSRSEKYFPLVGLGPDRGVREIVSREEGPERTVVEGPPET